MSPLAAFGRGGSTWAALDGVDGVVHLAGEPIAQRWTGAPRKRILESRVPVRRNCFAAEILENARRL